MVTGAARRWRVGTAYWGRVFSVAKFKVATRAPLSLNDINTLIDVAVGLHEVAADRIKDRRWMIQLLVPLAGSVLVGLLAFAAVYLKTKS